MFPPDRHDFYIDRVTLKADLPWEPWLHAGVWIAVAVTLVQQEWLLYPPGDAADWVWLLFGLLSPPLGFASVWMLEFHRGRVRYIAIWMRMVADIGLSVALISYLINRAFSGQLGAIGITGDIILATAAWFNMTLVSRDIRFIVATEKLAALIYRDVRCLTVGETAGRLDDASR